ncbi:hypothetical protein [Photobacterium sanguinicancri]|uniref:hypothetical protein n=1 Tax=Photobacterium sanguinicancri TaxID=875932 RepID=UPI0026E417B9|nr:hypothetical protein [Photobacterium sanguinicancri]MDO6501219.1 hypothetical protein [Photobacterium sanguinicancri]
MEQEVGRNLLGKLVVSGKTIDSFDIAPNSFADMTTMNSTDAVTVRLFDIVSYMFEKDTKIELSVKNLHKNDVFLLVFGGWIPCSFIKNNTILLADRNIVSEIVSRYQNGKKKKDKPADAFDSIFLNNKVSLDITAFVLEGNEMKIPDNGMIDEQVASVTKSLKTALPNLNITKYPNGNGYYYMFRDMLAETILKRMGFLQNVASKLNKQFTEKSREAAVKLVFCSAEELQLQKSDIAVLLALLRITMVGKKTAAQLVLKDSQVYSEVDSYNAVCDLSAIELLVNMHNFHVGNRTGYNVAFITKDKGLSLFSSLLSNTTVTGSNDGNLNVRASITGEVFDNDPVLVQMYEDWFAGKI